MANKTTYVPRLKVLYSDKLVAELKKELDLANVHQVPKLEKIMVSVGTGKKKDDKHHLETVKNNVAKVTGQIAVERKPKKSIASFKIRKGMGSPVGVLTTLRGARMYEFLDRFINVSLPHVRDFHGVKLNAFDAQGNYSLGITEQSIFPELSFEDTLTSHGMEITFVIKNGSALSSKLLLEKFGLPFEREEKK
ncbi:50S ribosomal protein L5 [Candidatus Saccharibacteria bacterium]|nr:50S ribosomal protein L5 [Candidatus Saccharibacteria bacterium]